MKMTRKLTLSLLAAPCLMAIAFISGCENDKEVLDVDTPDGGVEVEQDRDTGAIEVETDD